MSDFTLRGVDTLTQRLTSISSSTRKALSQATLDEAESIVDRARSLVPVRTGALRDTIRVVTNASGLQQGRDDGGRFTSGADIVVAVAAGDDSTPQAVAIHEHPSPHSPPSWSGVDVHFNPSGTGAKYLERPLLDSIVGMAERVGAKVGPK